MISQLVIFAENLFVTYGAWGVFLASIVEEVIAPIPSSLVIMGAGFSFMDGLPINVSSLGYLMMFVVLPATIGVTIGSLFIYTLAYFAGKPFLKKYGKYVGVSWQSVEETEAKFASKQADSLTLFALRAVPIVPSVVISALSGIMRISILKYIICTFLGTFIRATILGIVGWQAGSLYKIYAEQIDLAENAIIIGLIVIFLAYIGYRIFKKKI
ncbi:MAG: VTT domain-containing protein [Patescibacteria group bacterium]